MSTLSPLIPRLMSIPFSVLMNSRYTILTQYAFSIFTSTNLLPSTWLLEGRQNPQGNPLEDDEGWVTLDRKESYTTRDTNSRTVFFVVKENRHLCNEYRFVYIYANYENQIHISELELYTFDYPSEMPPFEYKKPYVNAILNTYIDRCTINNTEYYYNFTSDPSLPDGFSLDPMNGYITGMVSAESDINEYTISAIGVDGKTYSTKMYFTFLRCSTSNTLFSITTNFNNLYRDVYFSINDPNQSIPIYSTLTLEDLYPRYVLLRRCEGIDVMILLLMKSFPSLVPSVFQEQPMSSLSRIKTHPVWRSLIAIHSLMRIKLTSILTP